MTSSSVPRIKPGSHFMWPLPTVKRELPEDEVMTLFLINYMRCEDFIMMVYSISQLSSSGSSDPITSRGVVYSSTLLSPLSRSPGPSPLTSAHPPSGSFSSPPCLELPLPQGRLEPGKGVKASLILQGTSLSPSLSNVSDIPWNVVFYYEPALISANSRLR